MKEWKSEKVKHILDSIPVFINNPQPISSYKNSTQTTALLHSSTLPPLHYFGELSTQVHKPMWITVSNLWIKGFGNLAVDKARLGVAVVHKLSTYPHLLQVTCGYVEKKLLDRLSPYPQSLLLLLNIKISY